jgi:N6-L-threonylcarbamoyladenine synthase
VRANVVASQADLHARFGGVVPEVASRRHLELVAPVLGEALARAGVGLESVETVAVTRGPGLIGALLVGLSAAKSLAWSRRLPLVPVDHLHGHVAALYLEPEPVDPPFLCLLASGGHTLLLDVRAERVAVVGGVAANSALRAALPDAALAPLELCTDNAAMIASAARYAQAIPFPQYLALDAYATAA